MALSSEHDGIRDDCVGMIHKRINEIPLNTLSTEIIEQPSSYSGPRLDGDHDKRRELNVEEVLDLLFGVYLIRLIVLGVTEPKEIKHTFELFISQDEV